MSGHAEEGIAGEELSLCVGRVCRESTGTRRGRGGGYEQSTSRKSIFILSAVRAGPDLYNNCKARRLRIHTQIIQQHCFVGSGMKSKRKTRNTVQRQCDGEKPCRMRSIWPIDAIESWLSGATHHQGHP